MAMEFCVKYDRKNEFRRLSDSLRTHLNQITRNTKGQNAISLTNPGNFSENSEFFRNSSLKMAFRITSNPFGHSNYAIGLWYQD